MKQFLFLLFLSVSALATDVQFSWEPSTTPPNLFTSYVLQKEISTSTWTDIITVPSNITSYLLKGLAPGTHTFRLVARNITADSAPTNSVTVSPSDPPQAPAPPGLFRGAVIP